MKQVLRFFTPVWIFACALGSSEARKLQVGPDKTYTMPMQVASVAQDGDTVEIAAGTYKGETATWRANNLVLRGTATFARLVAPAVIPNQKAIWVIQGRNTTVENIEFTGAKVPDENGAGMRQDGEGLTVRRCYFHGNENGILGGGGANSMVVVEYSEFADNGFGDGYSHNMYISNIASFTLRYCNSHHAKVGHLVKTRARSNHILYNRLMDEASGNSSYQIDIPDAGTSYVIGNVIQQGPMQDNSTLISFGAESQTNGGTDLYVASNTLVNDHASGIFIRAAAGTTVRLVNNLFVGPGTVLNGAGDTAGNLNSSNPGFVNRAGYDYHLTAGSPALNRGVNPGSANDIPLVPLFQYAGNASAISRTSVGPMDVGAFEYGLSSAVPYMLRRHPRDLLAPIRFDVMGRPKRERYRSTIVPLSHAM